MDLTVYSLSAGFLSAGIWFALPLTGWLVSKRFGLLRGGDHSPPVTSFALMTSAGILLWSVPILVAAVLGIYRAAYFGILGWILTVFCLNILRKEKRRCPLSIPHFSLWDGILALGIALVTVSNLLFPSESLFMDRDEGIYTSHGMYIANHGKMDIPYPWSEKDDDIFSDSSQEFYGLYQEKPDLKVPYSHLFPVWLAQAYSTFGHHGLFRFNALVAALAFAVFYGFCRTVLPAAYAVTATLFFAFNPSEIWVSRVNLTENLAQLFIWSGLFLFYRALNNDDKKIARWAGLFLGASTLVRIDAFVLLPLLVFAQIAQRVTAGEEDEANSTTWSVFFQVFLLVLAVSMGYYFIDSRRYFLELLPFLKKIFLLSVIAFVVRYFATGRVLKTLTPLATNRLVLIAVGVSLGIFVLYLYYVRPVNALLGGVSDIIKEYHGVAYGFRGASHADFSLINLSQYLSPVVVFSALPGWFLMLNSAVKRENYRHLLPLVIVFAGYACAYLWDPTISPGHFWAVRRFVPVVIPGFVFFSAVGMMWMFDLFPRKLSLVTSSILLIFLVGFTVRADKLIFAFAENKGYFAQFQALAEKLPGDGIVIGQGNPSVFLPLHIAFDRRLVLMHLDQKGDRDVLSRWVSRQEGLGKKVYLLLDGSLPPADMECHPEFTSVLERSFSETVFFPLPKRIVTRENNVGVCNLDPLNKAL